MAGSHRRLADRDSTASCRAAARVALCGADPATTRRQQDVAAADRGALGLGLLILRAEDSCRRTAGHSRSSAPLRPRVKRCSAGGGSSDAMCARPSCGGDPSASSTALEATVLVSAPRAARGFDGSARCDPVRRAADNAERAAICGSGARAGGSGRLWHASTRCPPTPISRRGRSHPGRGVRCSDRRATGGRRVPICARLPRRRPGRGWKSSRSASSPPAPMDDLVLPEAQRGERCGRHRGAGAGADRVVSDEWGFARQGRAAGSASPRCSPAPR